MRRSAPVRHRAAARPHVAARRRARRPRRPSPAQRLGTPPRQPLLVRRDAGAGAAGPAPRAAPARGSSGSSSPERDPRPAACRARAGGGRACRTRRRRRCGTASGARIEGGWVLMANYQRWVLLRRIRSRRQVHEVMTEFWENHLNVPANGDAAFIYRTAYGDAIRAHALGIVRATCCAPRSPHPAMGIYLDNAVSTKKPPQREPRPRAARAAHRRPRQPHRGRRQELRPDPHRLAGRHVEHLDGVVRAERPLDRPGDGPRTSPTPTPTPDGRNVAEALPRLPRPPPGDRPADRPQAGA